MEKTFLAKLYRTDRVLWLAAVLYIGGILYYCSRQREEFPFLLYGMYSLKESSKETYISYSVEVNGQELNYSAISDSKKELITSPLTRLASRLDSGTMTEIEKASFQKWMVDQCSSIQGLPADSLEVFRSICAYNETGQPVVLKKEKLFVYARH